MLNIEMDIETGIATFEPDGPLSADDFDTASQVVDAYLEQKGKLQGLIIRTKEFPGWDSFSGLIKHIKFVKNHHERVKHVALVTDSRLGDLAGKLNKHFVSAEIRHFPFDELGKAQKWIFAG